jgi:hypothetical protein
MSKRFCQAVLAVLWLSRPGTALPSDDIVGVYQYAGPVAATLEVCHEAGQYVVRLEGGGASAEGPATAADCVVEAGRDLDGVVLRARLGPVETDTFSYGAAQAESEARMGATLVIEADTVGDCGLGVEFSGRGPRYNFHSLRHFAASWLISQGFSAKKLQAILGHNSIQMTFDTYGHLLDDGDDDHRRLDAGELALVG